jgi:hypothetical protein
MQARNRQASGQRLFQTAFDQLDDGRRAALAITISLTGSSTDRGRNNAMDFVWTMLAPARDA